MSDEIEPRLATVLAEVEALRAENARLCGLLNLDARDDDGHRHAWAPTLFTQPPTTPVLDSTASPEDELALMRSLFGARTDVFALRWENASSGKSGWSPAVRGGWANKHARKDYLPLTDDVIVRHLRGEATVGIYPLMRGDTCTLLACDFDGGTWVLDALAYLDAATAPKYRQ